MIGGSLFRWYPAPNLCSNLQCRATIGAGSAKIVFYVRQWMARFGTGLATHCYCLRRVLPGHRRKHIRSRPFHCRSANSGGFMRVLSSGRFLYADSGMPSNGRRTLDFLQPKQSTFRPCARSSGRKFGHDWSRRLVHRRSIVRA